VRRYLASLRRRLGIQKVAKGRQYQAVADPPLGQQLQVDFGERIIKKANGGTIRLRVVAAVLANSRYKWGLWSDKPFTSRSLVAALQECFHYLGGVPEELVFDQDHLVSVSENYGDIIYTEEFERFKQLMKFRVYLCRARDPESKGRIEAVVKYIKNNYAKHRLFSGLDQWNEGLLVWLARTGNQKMHSLTQKVPEQVCLLEKQHLRPIPITDKPKDIVTRVVRKDNTVMFNCRRTAILSPCNGTAIMSL
jgi:transposase